MSSFSLWEFQKSLYAALTADGTLMGMISGVYDHVPQDSAYPYVTIGDASADEWATTTSAGSRMVHTLRSFSRGVGRKEAEAILARLHALLHLNTLSVTGQTVVMMRVESVETRLLADGATYEGRLRLRVWMEAN